MIFLNSVELMSFLNDVLYDKLREKPPEDIRVEIATYGLSFSDKKFKMRLFYRIDIYTISAHDIFHFF